MRQCPGVSDAAHRAAVKTFLPFLLTLFLIAAMLRVEFFFTVLYFLAGAYVLTRLWTRRAMANVRATRSFADRAFAGDAVPVEYTVRNAGLLPVPWLEIAESVPLPLQGAPWGRDAVSLGGREVWRRTYTLTCARRGLYRLGPLALVGGDLLGIERRAVLELAPAPLLVYPRIVPLERLGIPARSPFVALRARAPLFEDASRLLGVRPYATGDSPRRIHWSASAHAGSLLVKRYQPTIARETLICLDMSEGGYDTRRRYEATELAVTTAASIAHHVAEREGLPVGLATEAYDALVEDVRRLSAPPRRERSHLITGILEPLARVGLASTEPSLPALLRAESTRLSWGATIVVITGRETAELYEALLSLRRGGYSVAVVLVHPPVTPPELRGRAEALGIRVHRIRIEQDLEAWR